MHPNIGFPRVTPSTLNLFSKITHLDVYHPGFPPHFPSLTHLIIHDDLEDFEHYGEVWTVSPMLKVVIVRTPGIRTDRDLTSYGLDLRVVQLDYDIVKSWRSNAWGDTENAWTVAEKIVEERRARALTKKTLD